MTKTTSLLCTSTLLGLQLSWVEKGDEAAQASLGITWAVA